MFRNSNGTIILEGDRVKEKAKHILRKYLVEVLPQYMDTDMAGPKLHLRNFIFLITSLLSGSHQTAESSVLSSRTRTFLNISPLPCDS